MILRPRRARRSSIGRWRPAGATTSPSSWRVIAFRSRLGEGGPLILLFRDASGKTDDGGTIVILIQFPNREAEIRGLSVLMSRFSGKVLRGGLHIVPEPALEALKAEKIPYDVKGPATYEHEVAALRGDAAATIQ